MVLIKVKIKARYIIQRGLIRRRWRTNIHTTTDRNKQRTLSLPLALLACRAVQALNTYSAAKAAIASWREAFRQAWGNHPRWQGVTPPGLGWR